ncbi:MAG TPA: S1-like domain-containing RNA-binding protein [Flavobacteriales bacterium]|nr:S1-like domain-containing RNA-binding protein [Flavobacteriales bacterium]
MSKIGSFQDFEVIRTRKEGLILGDDDADEALLPRSDAAASTEVGKTVRAFVYHNTDGQLLATTKAPKALVGEFAQMKVMQVDTVGAHVDMGLDATLIVPHTEQKKPMTEGRWYVVRVAINEQNNKLYGSTRIEDFLDNSAVTKKNGDAVQLIVFAKSELGLSVVVNNKHQGLIHANDIFRPVSIGDRITGYVKNVREDKKLDITLQPIGYRKYNDVNAAMLAKRLQNGSGFLALNDNSSAEEIHAEFGISKKAFKKALGALFKERLVRIEEEGVVWIG